MKKNKSIYLTILLSLFSLFAISQRDKTMNGDPNLEIDSVFGNFMLVNSADSSRSFKLRDNSSYTLTHIEHPKDGVTREKIYFSNGNIRDLFDTKIDFDVINESIEQNLSDSSTINTMIVSAALVIALAPLLNIKYVKENATNPAHMTMNETGYFNITKVGLIGFAAGFPISYFTRIKRYQITDNKIKNDKDFWYLSKETAY